MELVNAGKQCWQMLRELIKLSTKAEIMKEVRRRVGDEWPALLELVKDCHGPNDGACLVSISSIYLRIQKKVRNQWVNVGLVEIRIPLGC